VFFSENTAYFGMKKRSPKNNKKKRKKELQAFLQGVIMCYDRQGQFLRV